MGKKVKILTSEKTDGRYNYGKIVGIELLEDRYYLGYIDEREFLNRFTMERYKVAYIDCVTNRANTEWVYVEDLE